MRKIEDMEIYTWEETQDELFGKPGTREREEYEKGVAETIKSYKNNERRYERATSSPDRDSVEG